MFSCDRACNSDNKDDPEYMIFHHLVLRNVSTTVHTAKNKPTS